MTGDLLAKPRTSPERQACGRGYEGSLRCRPPPGTMRRACRASAQPRSKRLARCGSRARVAGECCRVAFSTRTPVSRATWPERVWRRDAGALPAETIFEAGPWSPGAEAEAARGGYGLLLLDGLIIRRVGAPARWRRAPRSGRSLPALPGRRRGHRRFPSTSSSRSSNDSARRSSIEPSLSAPPRSPRLRSRSSREPCSAHAHSRSTSAIVHYPQVRNRLLLLFSHLAERWGRVTRKGSEFRCIFATTCSPT